jgi:hypothetical protein
MKKPVSKFAFQMRPAALHRGPALAGPAHTVHGFGGRSVARRGGRPSLAPRADGDGGGGANDGVGAPVRVDSP